jgi:hypothetical protein
VSASVSSTVVNHPSASSAWRVQRRVVTHVDDGHLRQRGVHEPPLEAGVIDEDETVGAQVEPARDRGQARVLGFPAGHDGDEVVLGQRQAGVVAQGGGHLAGVVLAADREQHPLGGQLLDDAAEVRERLAGAPAGRADDDPSGPSSPRIPTPQRPVQVDDQAFAGPPGQRPGQVRHLPGVGGEQLLAVVGLGVARPGEGR